MIEDDDIVARTIELCLRGGEFKVTLTHSGAEGLQAARQNLPDLVLLDVIMPGMDGYAVCQEMRADPILKDVPILFLTAKAKDEDKITGFTSGADDYLTKPFYGGQPMEKKKQVARRNLRWSQARILEDRFGRRNPGPRNLCCPLNWRLISTGSH
jgi:DNA-binding response OmpR family regulator